METKTKAISGIVAAGLAGAVAAGVAGVHSSTPSVQPVPPLEFRELEARWRSVKALATRRALPIEKCNYEIVQAPGQTYEAAVADSLVRLRQCIFTVGRQIEYTQRRLNKDGR